MLLELYRRQGVLARIVVPSECARDVLVNQGFTNAVVIPHALSRHLLSFESDPSCLAGRGIPDDKPMYFCAVRADEHKDPHIFVRAAGQLKREGFIATYVMLSGWGDELLEDELEELGRVHGLAAGEDLFLVPPFSYGTELATVLRSAFCVVVPSVRESFGQSVLDAFMFGTPVVARDSMALGEIVRDEESGLLFSTAAELAEQMFRVHSDAALRKRIVGGGEEAVRREYDLKRMVRAYGSLYDEVTSAVGP
jgi:glycosyltransferase involved in cell wall biosynthesis